MKEKSKQRLAKMRAHYLLFLCEKNQSRGSIWIRLIVYTLILGVLASLVLPSLLSQTNKAKQVEGRNNIGAMNRAQQAYVLENGVSSQIGVLEQGYNTESYNPIDENGFQRVSSSPLSTFSIDVDTASYSNVRRFINQGQLPPKDAVRIEELINYFDYDYPQPEGDRPFSITTEVSQAPWNSAHKLVHIGLQGKKIPVENLPPSNLVFLLDVSGSMSAPNKLPLLKSAFRLLADKLTVKDRVSIVVYAGAAGVVLPPTPGNDRRNILSAIDKLEAGGSTAGGEGIKLAYQLATRHFIPSGNNRVILATDGDFNVGVSSDAEMVRWIEDYRERGIFLTVLGFGMGNLKDSKMEQMADKGNGNYAYIDSLDEAKKVLVNEMASTLLTIAKDVKIQVEFNPDRVRAYRLIGYENRMLQDRDFKDDKKDAGELGAGHSVTALYEIIPAGVESDVKLSDVDPLRYQQKTVTPTVYGNDELMLVKLRYKAPQETTSQLIAQPIADAEEVEIEETSNNFKFSASVAEFGMILRDSEYKGEASFDQVLSLANQSRELDLQGYRAEFIRLVQSSKTLPKAEPKAEVSSSFGGSLDELGVGIRPETTNYKYTTRQTEKAVFNYAIPRVPNMKSYVGVVWQEIDPASQMMTTRSILCEAKSPSPTPMAYPADPIYQNGEFVCGDDAILLGN